MSRAEEAVSCFNKGFSCSQAVLSTYSEQYGMDKADAFKVACAFGGGMSRMAGPCGAVTGALMVIGLKYGKYQEGDEKAKEKTYALTNEFSRRFIARNGSINCKELLGCDIGTPEGMKYGKEHNLTATLCPKFVRDAAEIVEEMLKEQ
jgi:C_GCAxxG_C_C family probable redox protein